MGYLCPLSTNADGIFHGCQGDMCKFYNNRSYECLIVEILERLKKRLDSN
jgi:hypothetical protein